MAAHNRLDLTGITFGRLTVLEFSHTCRNRKGHWRCSCSCGETTIVAAYKLRSGHTSSCGCYGRVAGIEHLRAGNVQNFKHGQVGTPAYRSWAAAKERCFNPSNHHYPTYGALGVTMCERWRSSFQNFLDDMGERPEGRTLDRYPDPFGDYEPGNCRWATPLEQSRNRRNQVDYRIFDSGMTLADAVAKYGKVSLDAARDRIRRGWDAETALLTPAGQKPIDLYPDLLAAFLPRAADKITVVI